jgi:uncharacterized protein YndB with AHSA1/START domain
MAIYEIAAATRITTPPAQLWAVLDDFQGWPRWMPALNNVQIELLSSGAPRVGYCFRVRGPLVHADLEVTRYTPLERQTTFRLSFPPITGDNRCVLTPQDDGAYLLERIDHINLPSRFISFLDKTQRARFERLAREFLVALKDAAEAPERSRHHAAA